MGPRGELGPLDIQVSEKDEPFRSASGLELFTALNILAHKTFRTFETYLLGLIGRSASQIPVKAAAKIATELTVGIMSPSSEQIDPLQLGRQERALNIVKSYAERLEVPHDAVAELATGYPDHGFVIDLKEAQKLLPDKARGPSEAESRLERVLSLHSNRLYEPSPNLHDGIILRLNDLPTHEQNAIREKIARNEDADGQAPDLRGDQEGERPEVDGERPGDGAELHQTAAAN